MIPIDKVVHGQAISNENHRGGGTSQKKSWETAGWHAMAEMQKSMLR